MKTIITSILLFIAVVSSVAQSNIISGKVVDNNNTPLTGVSVYFKNTKQGTETDFNGNFTIEKNNQTKIIVFSYVGFKTKEITLTEKTDLSNVILFEGNELLQEIVVKSRNNTFSRKKTAYVSKLPLKDMENPIVYSTVTNELLESQIVTNFDDAIVNATGISKLWEATGRSPGEGTGFYATRGFNTQPALVNGMPGFTFSAVDPSYIERIEVIKGPSATLFGSTVTSFGGLINVVTKKPYEGFGGSITYTGGSFNTNRISADINTSIGNNNDLFFRINTSYLTQDTWQDAGFKNTLFVAPSLSYRVNNKLNISVGLEYSETEQTNPSMLFLRRGLPLIAKNVEDLSIDPNKSYTSNDVTLTSPIFNTRAIADYKISDNWTSQTVFASSHSEAYGYYQYMTDGSAAAFQVLQPLSAIPGVTDVLQEANSLLQTEAFTRIYDKRDAWYTKANIQQNFTGDFKLGSMRHRIVAGLDYVTRDSRSKNKRGNSELALTPTFAGILGNMQAFEQGGLLPVGTTAGITAQLNGFPYFDGVFAANGNVIQSLFTPNATYATTKAQLDAVFNQLPINDLAYGSSSFAAYISDVVNITDNLTLNVGLRLDYFDEEGNKTDPNDDYTKTTFSPNAGFVYQPIPNKLTLFGNYQTGFINNESNVSYVTVPDPNNPGGYITDVQVQSFEPTKATQFEAGIKTNLINGKLNAGVSYYHITANDNVISDPTVPLFPESVQIDERVSQGIEFEVNTNPINGLNLRASYSYNDSKITNPYNAKNDINYDSLQDRRPEDAGPETVYNFWADYKFTEGSLLEKFGIAAGFNGASEHLTINNAISGQFVLPSYTIYNTSVYYNANKFRVGLKVNNLTDETYYKGWSTVNAQAPRAFLGTISYKF